MYVFKVKFEIVYVFKKLNNFKVLKVNFLIFYNFIMFLFFGFI